MASSYARQRGESTCLEFVEQNTNRFPKTKNPKSNELSLDYTSKLTLIQSHIYICTATYTLATNQMFTYLRGKFIIRPNKSIPWHTAFWQCARLYARGGNGTGTGSNIVQSVRKWASFDGISWQIVDNICYHLILVRSVWLLGAKSV